MDPIASSSCVFCKKVGGLRTFKVECSESENEGNSHENELIGDFIVGDLLNIEIQEWKDKLGLDQSQPLTLSLCRSCAHKVWECLVWRQQITRATNLLEDGRRKLTERLYLSGFFSDGTREEQECTYWKDDTCPELYIDFAESDCFNNSENQGNGQFNNLPRNGKEGKQLGTYSSAIGSTILNYEYADESSDSMELSPEHTSQPHQSPSNQVNSLSLPKETAPQSLSPTEISPSPPPSPPLTENVEQPPPAKKPMRTNVLGTILQNTLVFGSNADANKKKKAQLKDDVQISPAPVKPKKDITINGFENDIHSPVVSSEPVRSPSIPVNSLSLQEETVPPALSQTETFIPLPTSPPPTEISPSPPPSPHPIEAFPPPPPPPPQTENLPPPPKKKPMLTNELGTGTILQNTFIGASNTDATKKKKAQPKDNVKISPAFVKPKGVITNGSEININIPNTAYSKALPRIDLDIDWKQITKRKLSFDEVDRFSPWVKDHIHKLRVYKCPRCCAFYERRIWFAYHMRRHEKKMFTECKLCDWYLEADRRPLHRLYAHDFDNLAGKVQNRAAPFLSEGFEFLTDFKRFDGAF